jgi:hypothetical protein
MRKKETREERKDERLKDSGMGEIECLVCLRINWMVMTDQIHTRFIWIL